MLSARGPAGEPSEASLTAAADWLGRGWPVVVPSETVYGLAARAVDRRAVARVFEAKGRPSDNPLIVHVASEAAVSQLDIELSPLARALARRFWPGPLTLIVPFGDRLPWVTAGLDSIALRVTDHPFFRALLERTGALAAPSANRSGRPSPSLAAHAFEDLRERIPLVVDDGLVQHGLESTVVDTRDGSLRILRHGAISREQLREAAAGAGVELDVTQPGAGEAPRSPGLKYRHYSPRATMWLYRAGDDGARQLRADAADLVARHFRVGAVTALPIEGVVVRQTPDCPQELARHLFRMLRELDAEGVDYILIQKPPPDGVGEAIIERLTRAAAAIRNWGEPLAREGRPGQRRSRAGGKAEK